MALALKGQLQAFDQTVALVIHLVVIVVLSLPSMYVLAPKESELP
ncbi:hypothetical protein AAGW05_15245 [Arthrobacter sp. LAPM80]